MKNNAMRIATFLLALTLITSCFVGGTFAKYVTGVDEATDTARVAKWGVKIEASESDGFLTSYAKDEDTTIENTVVSTEKVVAPGTEGTLSGLTITGTPEVAVRVERTGTLELSDNWMVGDAFYCPIVITIAEQDISGLTFTSAEAFENAVNAALTAGSAEYAPGTVLEDVITGQGEISWAWAFEGDDVKDTALGDAAAEGNAATITLTVDATVTQID